MEYVEGLVTFGVYVVVIAAVAMMTPRIGAGIMALASMLGGRGGGVAAGEGDAR